MTPVKHYPGEIAYWETVRSGLIRCKVLEVFKADASDRLDVAKFELLEDSGPYRKGEVLQDHSFRVVPKDSLRKYNYTTHILQNFVWDNKENSDD